MYNKIYLTNVTHKIEICYYPACIIMYIMHNNHVYYSLLQVKRLHKIKHI